MTTTHLRVKNWERFQHYRKRNPPWIRLYNELLDDYAFSGLQDASKWHAVGIWLLASRFDNRIPDDPAWIARRINASGPVNLEVLVSAGFLLRYEDASNALASCKQSATPEGEGEGEAERESDEVAEATLSSSGSTDADEQGELLHIEEEPETDPAVWMHHAWERQFGNNGHALKLTEDRRQKYRAMYREQLKDTPDPRTAWRAVLHAVSLSSHHTSNRAYLMPESLLKNANRRDRWVEQTMDTLTRGPPGPDRERARQVQELADYLKHRGNDDRPDRVQP